VRQPSRQVLLVIVGTEAGKAKLNATNSMLKAMGLRLAVPPIEKSS
jgi:hypothetical protein